MSIIIKNARYLRWHPVYEHAILVDIPEVFNGPVGNLMQKCNEKHNSYIQLRLDTPRKPRTTGPGSQSAHLHGHLQQMAQHMGLSLEETKTMMKVDCAGWPHKAIQFGEKVIMVPISEADADTVAESLAIEWCHYRAADLRLTLEEGDEA